MTANTSLLQTSREARELWHRYETALARGDETEAVEHRSNFRFLEIGFEAGQRHAARTAAPIVQLAERRARRRPTLVEKVFRRGKEVSA